jgi:serine palmitoyltransferase
MTMTTQFSATAAPAAEMDNEKSPVVWATEEPRRTTTKKASMPGLKNRFAFFSTSPKNRNADIQAVIAAQEKILLNNSSPNAKSLSLPSISLSSTDRPSAETLFQAPTQEQLDKKKREDAQFGPLLADSHLYSSRFEGGEFPDPIEDTPPYYFVITTYISYLILIIFGHVRDFFGKRFRPAHYAHLQAANGYAPLNSDFDNFYTRRLKMRINDCFSRPTTGVPGRYITLMDRESDDHNNTFRFTGANTETLNMSSYNYLGFAQSEGPCADTVEDSLRKYGISTCSTRADVGTADLHKEVEGLIADFVGKPSAMVFSMGFVTNAAAFPALVGKGSIIVSDELNHASIRFGARLSGAMVTTFKHNNMKDLERLLRDLITQGQPRTHRPWKKILVAVEGLYSMEGTMCNLPALVELRKKYKFHLFVDEAHSIGALGPNGRGVCDYFGIDPSEVDILMGTLTKSFGANGGYVAADEHVVQKLRVTNSASQYGESPTPPVLMQIKTSLQIIQGVVAPGQGRERLQRLAFNSRYLRLGLKRLGLIVYGHDDSPIIPVMLYNPGKMPSFSHEMLRRNISVVVVGYPATPLISSRARFCVSAAHNVEDLERMLKACDEIGDVLQLKFSSGVAGGEEPIPEGMPLAPPPTYEEATGGKPINVRPRSRSQVKPPRWQVDDVLARGVADTKVPLR